MEMTIQELILFLFSDVQFMNQYFLVSIDNFIM